MFVLQLFILLAWFSKEASCRHDTACPSSLVSFEPGGWFLTNFFEISTTSFQIWNCQLVTQHARAYACTHRGGGELRSSCNMEPTAQGTRGQMRWEIRKRRCTTLYENKPLQLDHSQNELLKYSGGTWVLRQYEHSPQKELHKLKGLLGILGNFLKLRSQSTILIIKTITTQSRIRRKQVCPEP